MHNKDTHIEANTDAPFVQQLNIAMKLYETDNDALL